MLEEEKVRFPSLKKYPCKRNKGEHVWGESKVINISVRYLLNGYNTHIWSDKIDPKHKFLYAQLCAIVETRCNKCGKKHLSFLSDKLK